MADGKDAQTSVDLDPTARFVAATSDAGMLLVSEVLTGRIKLRVTVHGGRRVQAVAFEPTSGSAVASGGDDGAVQVIDSVTGQMQLNMAHGGKVKLVKYSRDGRLLVSAAEGGVKVWNATTGALHWVKQSGSYCTFSSSAAMNESVVVGGTATQSSESQGGSPSRALDGNINQLFSSGSCTHTRREKGWWKLDFGSTRWITRVQVRC